MTQKQQSTPRRWGFTLIEMLVVVVIIGILATIATGVYSGAVERARVATTKDLIRQLEIGIARYEIELGVYPPSGSGDLLSPPSAVSRYNGTGYLYTSLVHSLSGNALEPASSLWDGPYINLREDQVLPNSLTALHLITRYNIVDPWGRPVFYVESQDYETIGSNFWGGTRVFPSTRPTDFDSNLNLPAPNPFYARGETYYNPTTHQIVSMGPDGETPGLRTDNVAGVQANYTGAGEDDITNFGF